VHRERFLSIDAFRGLTVAAMILVNNPGSWNSVYPLLLHAEWHGWTPADLVFPSFLFIVGMVIPFSFGRRLREGALPQSLAVKIFRRSAILFGLGILLNLIPRFSFAELRIPGVLQRIALCYLAGALIALKTRPLGRSAIAALFIAGYAALLLFVPVPGFGPGVLDPAGNLPGFVDGRLMPGHLYRPDFDPEGLLSTIPAVATVLLGSILGDFLRTSRTIFRKSVVIFLASLPLTSAGLLLQSWMPINKALWTPTFVLFTAGTSLLTFGMCFALIDGLRWKAWAGPFLALGANPLAVFVGSSLFAKILTSIRVSGPGGSVSLVGWLHPHLFAPVFGPMGGSFAYAAFYLLLWIALAAPLYRHRLYLKV